MCLHTTSSFSYIILDRKVTKRSHYLTGSEQEICLLVDFKKIKAIILWHILLYTEQETAEQWTQFHNAD